MDARTIPGSINIYATPPPASKSSIPAILKKPGLYIFLGAAAIGAASYMIIKRAVSADEAATAPPVDPSAPVDQAPPVDPSVPATEAPAAEPMPVQAAAEPVASSAPSSSGSVPTFEPAAGGLQAVTLGQMQAPAPLVDGSVKLAGIGLAPQSLYKPAGFYDTGKYTEFTGKASGADFKPPLMGSSGWVDTAIGLHTNRGQSRDLRGGINVPVSEGEMPEGASIPNFGPMVMSNKTTSVRNIKESWPEGVPPAPITGFHSGTADSAPPIMPQATA